MNNPPQGFSEKLCLPCAFQTQFLMLIPFTVVSYLSGHTDIRAKSLPPPPGHLRHCGQPQQHQVCGPPPSPIPLSPIPPSGIRETGRRSQPTGAYIDIKKSALLRRTDWSLPHTWDGWRFHDKVWPLFCVSHQKFSSFCVSCFTQSLGGRQSLAERFEICTDWARVVRKFGPNLAELVLTWAEPYLQFQQKTRGKNCPNPYTFCGH